MPYMDGVGNGCPYQHHQRLRYDVLHVSTAHIFLKVNLSMCLFLRLLVGNQTSILNTQ